MIPAFLVEMIMGKDLQKAMKSNNGFTLLNTFLLCGALYMSNENRMAIARMEKTDDEIKSILRWKLNIDVNKGHGNEPLGQRNMLSQDVVLADSRTETKRK